MRWALASAISVVAGVTPACAATADCALIEAIARSGPASLRGIAAAMNASGQAGVLYRGKVTSMSGATDCELNGPPDIFHVECTWHTDGDLDSAKREHQRLKLAFEPCLVDPLVSQDYKSTVEGLEVLDYFLSGRGPPDKRRAEVSLEIQHYADIDGSYSVILSISR